MGQPLNESNNESEVYTNLLLSSVEGDREDECLRQQNTAGLRFDTKFSMHMNDALKLEEMEEIEIFFMNGHSFDI